jgi:predicted negative regulator of RcsB-dependent stress response
MAQHLDLEEQEQLDQLKHFWKQHGNWISWTLIVIFASIAGWNAFQYWQLNQSAQAAGLFDEAERAAKAEDLPRLEQTFTDMKSKYAGTVFAQQTGLLVARALAQKGKADEAKVALTWVAEQASDEGYRAIARLRLAAMLADSKAYEAALTQLDAVTQKEFLPLAADRRGDIQTMLGNPAKAKEAYRLAYAGLQDSREYRRLVEVKLNALGVDPTPAKAPAATGTSIKAEAKP